ncbi:hypothetical protein FOZ62_015620, partial [Perkinsus olseni]
MTTIESILICRFNNYLDNCRISHNTVELALDGSVLGLMTTKYLESLRRHMIPVIGELTPLVNKILYTFNVLVCRLQLLEQCEDFLEVSIGCGANELLQH